MSWNPVKSFTNFVSDTVKSGGDIVTGGLNAIGDAGTSLVKGASNIVNNVIENPLPVIETVALTWVLGPEALAVDLEPATIAAVSSAAVSAANGGDVQSIALSAGAAYLGSQAGKEIGNTVSPIEGKTLEQLGPQYADTAMLKQVVTSSSAAAATTALRGGDLNAVLTSGITGGVNSAVSQALKDQGYSNVDQRLLANATAAATSAILKGTSISAAIGSSVAATTLAATISGKVGQINKNNELGGALVDQLNNLKSAAQSYYDNNNMAELESAAKTNYQSAIDNKSAFDTLKNTFDTTYADYTKNKDWYENYDAKIAESGYKHVVVSQIGLDKWMDANGNTITLPPKDGFLTAANKDAATLNDLAPKINTAATAANNSINSFKSSQEALKPYTDYYTANFIDPATDLQTKITTYASSNKDLATQLGKDVNDYQGLVTKDATGVSNSLYDKSIVDQAVSAYKIADAQIAASGTQIAEADLGNNTATDAGAGANTQTVQSVYRKADDGTWQEFIPDGKGGYTQVPMQEIVWGNGGQGISENQPTGNVYVIDSSGEATLSPLSQSTETSKEGTTVRTLKDGSKVEYLADGTSVRTNTDGSKETYSADGNMTAFTPATKSSGSDLYDALELAFQNSSKAGVATGVSRNPDGSFKVGDTTIKPDGTVTGSGKGSTTVNPDGSVSVGPVTIGSGIGSVGGNGITTTASTDPAIASKLAAEAAAAAQLAAQQRANIGASQAGIMSLIPQLQTALAKAEAPAVQSQEQQPEVVKTTTPYNLEAPLDVGYFGEQVSNQQAKKDTQNEDGTVKIASGGFMDDLLELLHKRG